MTDDRKIDVRAGDELGRSAAVPVDSLAEVLVGAALQTSSVMQGGEEVDLQAELTCWTALFAADRARALGLVGEIRDLGAETLADRIAARLGVSR
jgi:hypothetical protein